MKSNNRQQTTDNKIFFRVFLFMFFVLCSLLFVRQTQATTNYPIPELGNCRDAAECNLYCDVPANTPACWSYDKNVLRKDILGDTTVNITYPITELDNCASAQECFIYCNQPQNQSSCLSFARKNGLVKNDTQASPSAEIMHAAQTELGCNSRETCKALCNNQSNMDKCRTFARKHGLERESEDNISMDILAKAQVQLGCDGRDSCEKFCKNPDNQSKCFDFAKNNNLMKQEDIQKINQMTEKKKELLDEAKTELGCDSQQSCYQLCKNPDNREKCYSLGKKVGIIKNQRESQTLPCTSETECKNYCIQHPDECPGMSGRPNYNASDTALNNPTAATKPGEFLGPSGCRTEQECKEYCVKHPDQCPGFPKPSTNTPRTQSAQNYSPSMPPLSPPQFTTSGGSFPPPSGFQQPIPQTSRQPIQQTGGSSNPPPPNPSEYPDR